MPLIVVPKEHRPHLARLTPEDVERLRRRSPDAIASAVHNPSSSADTTQTEGPAQKAGKRKHIDRSDQWPPVGTQLAGVYGGETFRAQVIAAPKLKSKKALRLLSPPVKGTVCTSYSKAQDVVTMAHRQKIGVKGKTGLTPAWSWWKPSAT